VILVCGDESNGTNPNVNQNAVTSISDQAHMLHNYVLFPKILNLVELLPLGGGRKCSNPNIQSKNLLIKLTLEVLLSRLWCFS